MNNIDVNLIVQSEDEDIELPLFDLATIAIATNNFSPACMIGAGSFGSVYKVISFLSIHIQMCYTFLHQTISKMHD